MNPNPHSNSVNSLRSDRSATSGFTLVEILAVLAVIAAIIAIGVPAISKVLQNGRVRNAEGTASVLKSAITQYPRRPDRRPRWTTCSSRRERWRGRSILGSAFRTQPPDQGPPSSSGPRAPNSIPTRQPPRPTSRP